MILRELKSTCCFGAVGSGRLLRRDHSHEGRIGQETLPAPMCVGVLKDAVGGVFLDLRVVEEDGFALPVKRVGAFGNDGRQLGLERDVRLPKGVREVLVEGARQVGDERLSGLAGDAVIDMAAQAEGKNEGCVGQGEMTVEELADLDQRPVVGIEGNLEDDVVRDVQAQRRVLNVGVDHDRAGEMPEKSFILLLAHGGDEGEAIVLVEEAGVGEGRVKGSGKRVEDGHVVSVADPGGERKGKRESGVAAMRGEDEKIQALWRCGHEYSSPCPKVTQMECIGVGCSDVKVSGGNLHTVHMSFGRWRFGYGSLPIIGLLEADGALTE